MKYTQADLDKVVEIICRHFDAVAGPTTARSWLEEVIQCPEAFIKERRVHEKGTSVLAKKRLAMCEDLYEHFSWVGKTKLGQVLK